MDALQNTLASMAIGENSKSWNPLMWKFLKLESTDCRGIYLLGSPKFSSANLEGNWKTEVGAWAYFIINIQCRISPGIRLPGWQISVYEIQR